MISMTPFSYTFSVLLLTSSYYSAIGLKTPSIPVGDDKSNWQALWKVLKARGFTKAEKEKHSTVFDTIIRANVRQRAMAKKDDGLFLYQGDIRMTKNDALRLFSGNDRRTKRAAMKKLRGNRWIRNSLVYELHPSLTSKGRQAIQAAIKEWEMVLPCIGKWRNIRYMRDKPRSYIQFYRGKGCNSPVGRQGKRQRISIGRGCETKSIAVHEIGHAMGMWHEQSRPDRDRYVKILWGNIIPEWLFAFRKITPNVINSFGVTYDYESVMHYPSTAFSKRSGLQTMISRSNRIRKMGNKKGLTSKDIEQARKMYRCSLDTGVRRKVKVCNKRDDFGPCPAWSRAGYCSHSLFKIFIRDHCKKSCEC